MMEKLKKIPEWAWIVILMAAITLKELYGILTVDYAHYLAELGEIYDVYDITEMISAANVSLMFGFSAFLSIVVYTAIFELLARIFYSFLLRRGMIRVPQREFVGGMRLFYIIYCLAAALISLIYLAIPDYVVYVADPIEFALSSLMLAAFLFVFARKIFMHGKAANGYFTLWSWYFILNFVFEIISFIVAFTAANATLAAKIAAGVSMGNMVIVAAITLIPLYFLKKLDKEPEEPEISVVNDDNDNGGGETFVGLGF